MRKCHLISKRAASIKKSSKLMLFVEQILSSRSLLFHNYLFSTSFFFKYKKERFYLKILISFPVFVVSAVLDCVRKQRWKLDKAQVKPFFVSHKKGRKNFLSCHNAFGHKIKWYETWMMSSTFETSWTQTKINTKLTVLQKQCVVSGILSYK